MSNKAQQIEAKYKKYPAYKPSGIDWLGNIPKEWHLKRLRFLIKSNPSKSAVQSMPSDFEISFIPMESVSEDGVVNLDQIKALEEVRDGYTYFVDGDIVIAKITPCFENGKGALMAGLNNGVGFGTTEFHVLRPRGIEAKYLHLMTNTWPFRRLGEANMKGAAGQKRVPENFIKDFELGIPSLEEQGQISTYLDRKTALIDDVIDRKQKLIKLLKEKRQALITQAVTKGLDPNAKLKHSGIDYLGDIPKDWQLKRLKYIFRVVNGATPKSSVEEYWSGDIPWATPDDLGKLNGSYIEETARQITTEGYNSCATTLVPPESIILSTRAPIGHMGVARSKLCMNQGCRGLVFGKLEVDKRYYYYLLDILKTELRSLGQGATFMELGKTKLESVSLTIPAQPEQTLIAEFLDRETTKIDSIVTKVKSQVWKLREYKQALITSAVTGKIDVRNS
ncbi:MAG: restriction endonuclease subunit S [candidate division Zixibacteria bacterium]|nr:restriction endonuclease subunit S [candidate division Zixibacteria bacterium]